MKPLWTSRSTNKNDLSISLERSRHKNQQIILQTDSKIFPTIKIYQKDQNYKQKKVQSMVNLSNWYKKVIKRQKIMALNKIMNNLKCFKKIQKFLFNFQNRILKIEKRQKKQIFNIFKQKQTILQIIKIKTINTKNLIISLLKLQKRYVFNKMFQKQIVVNTQVNQYENKYKNVLQLQIKDNLIQKIKQILRVKDINKFYKQSKQIEQLVIFQKRRLQRSRRKNNPQIKQGLPTENLLGLVLKCLQYFKKIYSQNEENTNQMSSMKSSFIQSQIQTLKDQSNKKVKQLQYLSQTINGMSAYDDQLKELFKKDDVMHEQILEIVKKQLQFLLKQQQHPTSNILFKITQSKNLAYQITSMFVYYIIDIQTQLQNNLSCVENLQQKLNQKQNIIIKLVQQNNHDTTPFDINLERINQYVSDCVDSFNTMKNLNQIEEPNIQDPYTDLYNNLKRLVQKICIHNSQKNLHQSKVVQKCSLDANFINQIQSQQLQNSKVFSQMQEKQSKNASNQNKTQIIQNFSFNKNQRNRHIQRMKNSLTKTLKFQNININTQKPEYNSQQKQKNPEITKIKQYYQNQLSRLKQQIEELKDKYDSQKFYSQDFQRVQRRIRQTQSQIIRQKKINGQLRIQMNDLQIKINNYKDQTNRILKQHQQIIKDQKNKISHLQHQIKFCNNKIQSYQNLQKGLKQKIQQLQIQKNMLYLQYQQQKAIKQKIQLDMRKICNQNISQRSQIMKLQSQCFISKNKQQQLIKQRQTFKKQIQKLKLANIKLNQTQKQYKNKLYTQLHKSSSSKILQTFDLQAQLIAWKQKIDKLSSQLYQKQLVSIQMQQQISLLQKQKQQTKSQMVASIQTLKDKITKYQIFIASIQTKNQQFKRIFQQQIQPSNNRSDHSGSTLIRSYLLNLSTPVKQNQNFNNNNNQQIKKLIIKNQQLQAKLTQANQIINFSIQKNHIIDLVQSIILTIKQRNRHHCTQQYQDQIRNQLNNILNQNLEQQIFTNKLIQLAVVKLSF